MSLIFLVLEYKLLLGVNDVDGNINSKASIVFFYIHYDLSISHIYHLEQSELLAWEASVQHTLMISLLLTQLLNLAISC